MSGSIEYHEREWRIILDPGNPKRNVPDTSYIRGAVLDVGCGMGQTLMAEEFAGSQARHGIDIDAEAIRAGKERFPHLLLNCASAEAIPYPDASFDLVFSRVALPYTEFDRALTEMFRVLRPGGNLWVTLHPWSMERRAWASAIRNLDIRRLVDRSYVLLHSALLALFGKSFPRPWNGTFESFQTVAGAKRSVQRVGFGNAATHVGNHFLVTAKKPGGTQE